MNSQTRKLRFVSHSYGGSVITEGSHKLEVAGASHSVYASRPKEVTGFIEEAASDAR